MAPLRSIDDSACPLDFSVGYIMRILPWRFESLPGFPRDCSRMCCFNQSGILPAGTSSIVTECSVGGKSSSPSVGYARRWLFNPLI